MKVKASVEGLVSLLMDLVNLSKSRRVVDSPILRAA